MSSPIPNLPPLSSIADPAVRSYLQALTDGWNVRNGNTGSGDEKFLTVKDLAGASTGKALKGGSSGAVSTVAAAVAAKVDQSIAATLQYLSDQVTNSKIWALVGTRITKIDAPDGTIATLRSDINTALATVGEGITRLDSTTATGFQTLTALKATVEDPDTGLAVAQAGLVQLNKVDADSTSANVQYLLGLEADVNNPATGLASKASAADVLTAFTDWNQSVAMSLRAGSTSIGEAVNANFLDESTARSTHDSAIVTAVNTLWGTFGTGSALAQDGTSIVVDNNGSVASKWSQLQSSMGTSQASANQALSLAQTINGAVDLSWSVRFDLNGYVAGFGIGVQAGPGDPPTSNFVVRADTFAIGAPITNAATLALDTAARTSFDTYQAAVAVDNTNANNKASALAAKVAADAYSAAHPSTGATALAEEATTAYNAAAAAKVTSATAVAVASADTTAKRAAYQAAANAEIVASSASPKLPFIVKTSNWTDNTVSPAKVRGPGVYMNEVTVLTANIAVASVTTANIVNANITTLKIADHAVSQSFYSGTTAGVYIIQPGAHAFFGGSVHIVTEFWGAGVAGEFFLYRSDMFGHTTTLRHMGPTLQLDATLSFVDTPAAGTYEYWATSSSPQTITMSILEVVR